MQPFLKWVGGKRRLLPEITKYIPQVFETYYEPFLGGGALFFALSPKNAVLSDTNSELINSYCRVRDDSENLLMHLDALQKEYIVRPEELYYSIRQWDRNPDFTEYDPTKRAARFIFLNKTCFNGLYRTNRKGEFNVPWGKYSKPSIYEPSVITDCSIALQNAQILVQDYCKVIPDLTERDFIYFDPPYLVSDSSKFVGYGPSIFTLARHVELSQYLDLIDRKGCYWLLSNSDCPQARDLYKQYTVTTINRQNTIASKRDARQTQTELVVTTSS